MARDQGLSCRSVVALRGGRIGLGEFGAVTALAMRLQSWGK
jgi:hypothetical protein